jgi:protein-S-isoprenylcysteine O-methyltransferase Ste14
MPIIYPCWVIWVCEIIAAIGFVISVWGYIRCYREERP